MASQLLPNNEPLDVTFRNYSSKQASDYVGGRLGYSNVLMDFILDHHRSTGGQNGALLDVGCGPGTATQKLAPHFDTVYGADPGESMITTATELGGITRSGAPIVYKLSSAEDIDKIDGIQHGSIDMITAATAAHWFEMPKFWKAAANLLKPGGTVAIWTVFRPSGLFSDKTQLQSIFDDFRNNVLAPYTTKSTHLTQNGYTDLVMPWDDPATASLYDRQTFIRHELGGEGGYIPAKDNRKADIAKNDETPENQLKKLERLVGTLGSVNRWQEANPELVGTDEDCVNVLMNNVRKAVDEGESIDMSDLTAKMAIALILVKRK
ncbi:hypothetical protein FSARC_8000 [Fusarium sarcochroum]|uniref:Methyltransferase type 11 domain-containing protein n=1 Tax=Fusarium sarcochroum TaxID=1208366 RepID=A0A8H4X7P3_9HYPO|nr:hypothetical protein FSARC_8000 [Fusarium sarcochroum]